MGGYNEGERGKDFQEHVIKDKIKEQVGSRVGSGDGWGGVGSRGGKWRQLFLNNNKKCGKKSREKN